MAAQREFHLRWIVSGESICITAICLLDLVSTLYWVALGHAQEGNPLMAHFLNRGVVWFIAAKIATFVPGVIACEWYRTRRPEVARRAMRWVIFGYVVLYLAGIAGHLPGVTEFYRNLLS
jgi:hypothetical protein